MTKTARPLNTGLISVIAIAALIGVPAIAQQTAADALLAGQVNFSSDIVNQDIKAKDKPIMVARGRAVGEAIVSTPALANPKGMAINWNVRVAFQQDGMPKTDPYPVRGFALIRKISTKDGSKPDKDGRYSGAGEGPSLKFTLNDPFAFYDGNIEGMNPATGAFDLPADAKWENGAMTFRSRSSNDAIAVIGRTDRAPFRHVTREEFINDLIAELYPDGADKYSKPGKGLAALKAELAEMSPADRASPACRNGKEKPNRWLTSCNDPGSHYKVKMNHAYFDTAKPRASTQLITFRVQANWVGEDKQEGDRLREAFSQIDMAAVRKLLD
jgi:hypothetical protein